jgi:hypothetical protein
MYNIKYVEAEVSSRTSLAIFQSKWRQVEEGLTLQHYCFRILISLSIYNLHLKKFFSNCLDLVDNLVALGMALCEELAMFPSEGVWNLIRGFRLK